MEEFNLSTAIPIEANNSLQDKIELAIGDWTLEVIDDFIYGLIAHLGRDEREGSENPHRVFQSTGNLLFGSQKLIKVLSPNNQRNSFPPLFSGQLKISKTGQNYFKLKLLLSINPTRFCAYQRPLSRRRGSSSRHLSNNTILFNRGTNLRWKDEFSLDKNDNVLFSEIQMQNASGEFYEQNLRKYILAIIEYIEVEIREYRHQSRLPINGLNFTENYSLRKIENYWEFSCEDPLIKIRQLEKSFRSLTHTALLSEYQSLHTEIDQLSLGLRCNLCRGERIKIYAKTNKRIRIEVEHNYSKNVELTENRQITSDSLDELINDINYSQVLSATSARTFVENLRGVHMQSNSSKGDAVKFINNFYTAIDDIHLAQELLKIILPTFGAPRSALNKNQQKALEKAMTYGLIQYKKRPHAKYVIHPWYLNAINELFQ